MRAPDISPALPCRLPTVRAWSARRPAPDRADVPRPAPAADRADVPRPAPVPATAIEANARRLRAPEGRAAYTRRAPDVEGPHANLKDQGGLRRFSLRGLHNTTSEFLCAGLARNLRLLVGVS